MLILFNIYNALNLPFPLEIVGLRVLTRNGGDFTFFIVGSKRWNCHARCTSAANTILRDVIVVAVLLLLCLPPPLPR
jgi:hypothetical protein